MRKAFLVFLMVCLLATSLNSTSYAETSSLPVQEPIAEEPITQPQVPIEAQPAEQPEAPVEEQPSADQPAAEPQAPIEEQPVEQPKVPVEEQPADQPAAEPQAPVEEQPAEQPDAPVEGQPADQPAAEPQAPIEEQPAEQPEEPVVELPTVEESVELMTNTDITSLIGTATNEEIALFLKDFSREMLLVAAYYYPELVELLNQSEVNSLFELDEAIIDTKIQQFSESDIDKLKALTPLVIDYYNQRHPDTSEFLEQQEVDAIKAYKVKQVKKSSANRVNFSSSQPISYTLKDAPYNYKHNTDGDISTVFRTFSQNDVDLYLPGREGLDITFTRSYDSSSSFIAQPAYICRGMSSIPCSYSDINKRGDNLENIATLGDGDDYNFIAHGWSLNIPVLNYNNLVDRYMYSNEKLENGKVLTHTNGTPYKNSYNVTLENGVTYKFKGLQNELSVNHPNDNVRLNREFVNVNHEPESRFTLTVNGKLSYVFDYDGRIIEKSNQFGQKVTYEYDSNLDKITITDSLKRKIIIDAISARWIRGFSVYNQRNELIKQISYDVQSSANQYIVDINGHRYQPGHISYRKLSSVKDSISGTTLKSYTYYEPSQTIVDFNFEDDWEYYQDPNTLAPLLDVDGVESSRVAYDDKGTYGEALALLIREVTDDTGFNTRVFYKSYKRDWFLYEYKDREAARGTTRKYIDTYLLKYVGYLPVATIYYSYTDHENNTKSLAVSVASDQTGKANEVWLRPKKTYTDSPANEYLLPHRLENTSGYRSGDKVNTRVTLKYDDYSTTTSYQYSVNKLLGFQLDSVSTETDTLTNAIEETSTDGTTYTFAPKQTTSYQYDEGRKKAYLTKVFDEGGNYDLKPQHIKDFLQNGTSRNLPADLTSYAIITKQEFDSFDNVIYQEDQLGNKVETQYNGPYQQVSYQKTTSSDGKTSVEVTNTYNADGTLNKTMVINRYPDPKTDEIVQDTVTTEYLSYTASKLPKHIRTSDGGAQYGTHPTVTETSLEYDSNEYLVTSETTLVTLASGQQQTPLTTSYQYDNQDRVKEISYPDSSKASYTYDNKDRLLTDTFTPSTGAGARTTAYTYDDINRTVTVTSPDGKKAITRYTPYGEQEKVTQQSGELSKVLLVNKMDSSGVLVKETLPFNELKQRSLTSYGANGVVSKVTDALDRETSYKYANVAFNKSQSTSYLQNTVRETQPDGKVTTTYKDKNGNVLKVDESIPGKTRTTLYAYTPFGQLSEQKVVDGNEEQITSYKYDAAGNLVYVKDAKNQTYQYIYNRLGQVVAIYINGKAKKTSTYNEIGFLLGKTNGGGDKETYTYKNNGLVDNYTDKSGQKHVYTYTEYGEQDRVSVLNSAGQEVHWTKYTYNPLTRLIEEVSNSENNSIKYGYDAWNRVEHQTVAGRIYSFGYDHYNRLERITYPGDNKSVTYTYDDLNRIDTVLYPDMGTVDYDYLTENNKNTFTVTYPNGIKQEKVLDGFKELVTVKHTNGAGVQEWDETYGFDGFGNVTSIERHDKQSTYTYDRLSRITGEKDSSGTVILSSREYSYDDQGNIKTITEENDDFVDVESSSLTYNALNQLKTYTKSGVNASYSYYADGLRASKTVNGIETRYVYVNGKVIDELDENNNSKARNIWGNALLFRTDILASQEGYYSYNGHGDVIRLTDKSGRTLNSYDYDIWGNIAQKNEKMSNPFRYTGEIYDDESGLIYLRARYYDPRTHRFITEDTYEGELTNPLSLNLYTYVHNNPVIYNDPTGHFLGTIGGAILGGIVGGITAAVQGTNIKAGIAGGAVTGAISGAAIDLTIATGGTAVVITAAVVGGAVGGATGDFVNQAGNNIAQGKSATSDINVRSILVNAGIGAGSGALGGATAVVMKSFEEATKVIFQGIATNALKSGDDVVLKNSISSVNQAAVKVGNTTAKIEYTTTVVYSAASNTVVYYVNNQVVQTVSVGTQPASTAKQTHTKSDGTVIRVHKD